MPRIRIASGGWHTLAVDTPQPAHMTRDDGTVVDLDAMLRRLRLMATDFDGAPSHAKPKPVRDSSVCLHGHPWIENAYFVPGTGTRICRACKDDARQRAREREKKSRAKRVAA